MADNTVQTGADTIATDDLATLNGGASGTVKVQRVKVGFGSDSDLRDVDASHPLPSYAPDSTASGTISATDAVVAAPAGDGSLVSGTPTASSYLACQLSGDSGFTIQLTGTFGGGTVWFEASNSSTNGVDGSWTTLSCRLLGTTGSTIADSATTAGAYRGDAAGLKWVRARIKGATTPSVAVVIVCNQAVGPLALNAPIPAGTSAIGTVDVRSTTMTSTSGNVAAAGTGTIGPLDVSRQGNVTIIAKNQTAGTAWAGAPVLVFEQSDDSTSWSPLLVVRNDNGFVASTHILAANAANVEVMFDAPCEAMNYVRVRVTTGPLTNPMTIVIQAGSLPFTPYVSLLSPQQSFISGNLNGNINTVRVTGTALATSTQLVAAPGAGLSIYVTDIIVGNSGAALTVFGLLPAAGTNVFDIPAAGGGGGAAISLKTPWKLAANTALNYVVSVATTTWFLTVSYYIAP